MASICVYGFNVLWRLMLGLRTVYMWLSGRSGSELDTDKWCRTRMVLGIILMMFEPVSGNFLLNSAFRPAPDADKAEVERRVQAAKNSKANLDAVGLPASRSQLSALREKKDKALRQRQGKVIVSDAAGKKYTEAYSVFVHNKEVEKCYTEAENVKNA